MNRSTSQLTEEEIQSRIQPLSWGPSILILLFLGMLYILAYHVWLPAYIERTGQPYLKGYYGSGVLACSQFFSLLSCYTRTKAIL
jgi:hypothetical protein